MNNMKKGVKHKSSSREIMVIFFLYTRWLSGSDLNLKLRNRWLEANQSYCAVSLSRIYLLCCLLGTGSVKIDRIMYRHD